MYSDAKESGKLDEISKDMDYILNLIDSNRQLELFFHSPIIDPHKKRAIIKEIFTGRVSTLMLDFLLLLAEMKRENIIKDIIHDYIDYKNEKDGVVDVSVTSAFELSNEEKENLKQKIDSYTNLKSKPTFNVDKSIIGGFVVNIKDTILDASIKRQLEILRKQFKEGDIALN